MNLPRLLRLSVLSACLAVSASAATLIDFYTLSGPDGFAITDGFGNSPTVSVSYKKVTTADPNGPPPFGGGSGLGLWNIGYGDLLGVAYSGLNGWYGVITLTPQAGYYVTLTSFDIAAYPYSDIPGQTVQVFDGATLAYDYSGTVTGAGPGPGGHDTHSPNFTSSGPISILWGASYNTGVNHILYDSVESVAPEPGSWILLLSGIGLSVFGRKRRAR